MLLPDTSITLVRQYKQAIKYPSIFVILVSIIYSLFFYFLNNREYSNSIYEWYEVVALHAMMAVLYCCIMALLSLTILLNQIEEIAAHKTLSFVSWCLLPFSFILLTIGKSINEFIDVKSIWELNYSLFAGIPFVVGNVKQFIIFKKLQKYKLN